MDNKESELKSLYVDKELKPITLEEWGILFEDFRYRLIAKTYLGSIRISTVWIGCSANGLMNPFETGIFYNEELIEEYRHDTEKDARDFHLMKIIAYVNDRFSNYLKNEEVCHQSHAPTAEQTLCAHQSIPKPLNFAIIA